jgi:GTPase SAR1 family protein
MPILAAVGVDSQSHSVVRLWELDVDLLLAHPAMPSVAYTTAKIVLVGESGVGKTGLGWRLAHGEFIQHASAHGQQFWLLDELCSIGADGIECEAVRWDLAGQPDYRLIHALYLDDADLALVLFDPTRDDDPLRGVEYWPRSSGVLARSS